MTQPLRLFFIRHGQTEDFQRQPFNGWRDAPLTALGRQQLDQVAEALGAIPFKAVYSSDLSRAVYGGRALAKRCGLELRIDERWREMHFGDWEGWTYQEIAAVDCDLIHRLFSHEASDNDECFPGGGESSNIFSQRINSALETLKLHHPDGGRVAVVCHGGVCKALWGLLLKIEPAMAWQVVRQDFAAVNVVDIYSSGHCMGHLMNAYVGPEGYFNDGPGFERLLGSNIF